MDPFGIAIGIAALALAAVRIVDLMGATLNYDALNQQLDKLFKANNKDRAIRLLEAAPRSPYARIARKMIVSSEALDASMSKADSERRLRSVYGSTFRTEMRSVERRRWMGWLAGALGAGAVFWGLGSPTSMTMMIGALAAGSAGIAMWLHRRLQATVMAASDNLVELLLRDANRRLPAAEAALRVPTLQELLGSAPVEAEAKAKAKATKTSTACVECGGTTFVERSFDSLRPLRACICRECGHATWRADPGQL